MRVRDIEMTSHDACTCRTRRILTVASLQRLKEEAFIPTPVDCEVRSLIKFFECTEHNADRNSSSAVADLWPHMVRRSTHLLQEFSWEVFNHPLYSPDLTSSDFYLFYTSRNSWPVSVSVFRTTKTRRWMSHSGSNPRCHTFTTYDTKFGPKVSQICQFGRWVCWKNNSTLSVSVPINISVKLGFVTVNGPRETYFVDPLRSF